MNEKKETKKKPYACPEITTHSSAQVLTLIGPALAVYGDAPFPP